MNLLEFGYAMGCEIGWNFLGKHHGEDLSHAGAVTDRSQHQGAAKAEPTQPLATHQQPCCPFLQLPFN